MSEVQQLELEPWFDVSERWARRASEFHLANPQVYELLVGYAHEARAAGQRRVGIELLWNRMRWDVLVQPRADHDFKLNQNYKAWYAREIMQREPELEGIFETRRRVTPRLQLVKARAEMRRAAA